MIITGTLTLITSVAYWYAECMNILLRMVVLTSYRFLFPDSPTNAWFLTMEERAMAVKRIQENQTGVENKHFKSEQYAPSFFRDPTQVV